MAVLYWRSLFPIAVPVANSCVPSQPHSIHHRGLRSMGAKVPVIRSPLTDRNAKA